jgi:maltooligosyltrehalose trehalohydrolase
LNISVWAPSAKSVELVTSERRIALRAAAGGEWHGDVDASLLAHGYRYSIDGGDPTPDPRSRWQPDGVHGASHAVGALRPDDAGGLGNAGDLGNAGGLGNAGDLDNAGDLGNAGDLSNARGVGNVRDPQGVLAFRPQSLRDAVIYELHVGTFTAEGTYAAAQAKLSHLVELGITHLELMPLATFPGRRGWGYDGVDLFAPFPAYGTPQELAAFVDACHARGLAVLLDVVYNHLGPDGNYLARYGPYFTDKYKTPWGAAINYDAAHSDAVRRFFIDNALMWLRDYGFDGLRLDAVHAIFSFDAVHVLEELATAVRELGVGLRRSFVLIAESDLNDPRLVHPPSRGGFGLNAHWSDDFHHALHRFFTGETDGYYADFRGLEDVARALRDGYVYQGQYSPYRGRRHGRPPRSVDSDQLVVSSQNHDQIGNRAQGERLSMMLGLPELQAIAALTLLSPFVPLLFQGEEWGARTPFLYFTDHENAELGRLVAEGRSKEFGSFRWQGAVPNPQEMQTFERSKLDWSEPSKPPHAQLFEWYRKLIRLRNEKMAAPPGTGRGKAVVKFDARAGWLTFVHGGVLCVFNFTSAAQRVRLPSGEWDLALRSDAKEAEPMDGVSGRTTLIYRRRRA